MTAPPTLTQAAYDQALEALHLCQVQLEALPEHPQFQAAADAMVDISVQLFRTMEQANANQHGR